MNSIQRRKRGSSPNLILGFNRNQISDKKKAFNYKTEQNTHNKFSSPRNSNNVFKRGLSKGEEKPINTLYSGQNTPSQEYSIRRQATPDNEYDTSKHNGLSMNNEQKNIVTNQSKETRKSKFSLESERKKISSRNIDNDLLSNTKKLTLGPSNPSSENEKKNLESLKGESDKQIHKRRNTDNILLQKNSIEEKNVRSLRNAELSPISDIDHVSEDQELLKIKSISGMISKNQFNENENELIDTRVVNKFKKLRQKREDRDSLTKKLIQDQKTKKLIPLSSNKLQKNYNFDSENKKKESNPIISGNQCVKESNWKKPLERL
jgi:hypothetical protein